MGRGSLRSRRARTRGFAYLGALLLVTLLGLGLAATGQVWHTRVARAREANLLWTGEHYRRAIERYYRNGPSQYPRRLEDLLQDPRKQNLERYLRTLYFDPVRGNARWGTVKAPDGGIMGVYSLAEGHPFKTAGFSEANADFQGAATYRDWKFVFRPPEQPTPQPGGTGG